MQLWQFETARFRVALDATLDHHADLSWRDKEQEEYDEAEGVEYFNMRVTVELDGAIIAQDHLGSCGYSEPRDFAREHRSADPMNRNCSIMRAANGGNVSICHYFPGMVANAVSEARNYLAKAPRVRTVA